MARKTAMGIAISTFYSKNSKGPRKSKLVKHVQKRDAKTFFEERGGEYKEPDFENRNILDETKLRMKKRGKLAKLELLLLDYTFNEDDGKISFGEKRAINKLLRSYNNLITKEDIEYILTISETSLSKIQGFIMQEKLEIHEINKALHTLKKICKSKEQYSYIITKLEQNLRNTQVY